MASKIIHVILRIWELLLSVIVVAILSYFVREVRNGHGYVDPLVIYILVVACISSAYAIITVVPLMVSFLAFPVDFIMFVLWLVAFCLAEAVGLPPRDSCSRWQVDSGLMRIKDHRNKYVRIGMVLELLGTVLGRLLEESRRGR